MRPRVRPATPAATSAAANTSPSRSSQVIRPPPVNSRAPERLPSPDCVETNQQAQAPGQEEGQPRQEAQLRARLTLWGLSSFPPPAHRSTPEPTEPTGSAPRRLLADQPVPVLAPAGTVARS